MADWSSPLTSLDRGLNEASMSDCMVAGISGWCGMSCPVLCAGKCEEEEMIEAKRDEVAEKQAPTPLLPPDPDKPGRYYIRLTNGTVEIWTWHPDHTMWHAPGWAPGPVSPELAADVGYTLATRHRIPTPAELEAVHQVVETLLDVANLAVITPQDEQHVGPVVYAASGAQVQALRDAAAMLRAALGGGA